MQRGSRWLSAAAVAVLAWCALAQQSVSPRTQSASPQTEKKSSVSATKRTVSRLTITALIPERAKPGATVTAYLSRTIADKTPATSSYDPYVTVLVGGEKARIESIRGDRIHFTVPGLETRSRVSVIVKYYDMESEPAPLDIELPVPATSMDATAEVLEDPQPAVKSPATKGTLWGWIASIAAVLIAVTVIFMLVQWRKPDEKARIVRAHLEKGPRPETEVARAPEPRAAQPQPQPQPQQPQPQPPSELVRYCADGECILFVGQGLDLIAGYPPLTIFLTEFLDRAGLEPAMRERLRQGLRQGETEAVLDILLATDAAQALRERVERHYRDMPPNRGALDSLRVIDFAGIVSTSWTPLVAQIFRGRDPLEIPLTRAENVSELLQSSRLKIIRLFGQAGVPDSLILTRTEMRQLIGRNDFFSKYLTSLLSNRPHLFIGVSGETIDEYFSALQWGRSAVRHFAVLDGHPKTALDRERLTARYGIEILETPAMREGLAATQTFVEDLARAVKADKASSSRQRAADVPTLGRLVLQNIGAFPALDLTLSPGWNVILGNNASGKSTILRAIAAALCGDDPRAAVVAERLLHAGASSGFVELTIGTDVYRAEFIRELKRVRIVNRQLTPLQTGKALVLGFPAIRGVAAAKGAGGDSSGDVLPSPDVSDILPLIAGESDPRTDSVKQWLIDLESRRLRAGGESWRLAELRNKFFDLLNLFTPGLPIQFANVDFDARQVFVKAGDAIIPLDYVSQGMISVVAWVGTLLQRMYAVRAKSEDPTKEAAIVLIDELDAHLHPEWQQEIVARLKAQFPNVQFIATTHSPLVVAGLSREEVFLAARDPEDASRITVIPSPIHFEGLRADQILTSPLFGLSSTRGPHVDRYTHLLAKRERTPDEERELEILRGSIAETEEVLKTRRLRHALDELASEQGFEALLGGQEIAPEMRERLLAAISREDRGA